MNIDQFFYQRRAAQEAARVTAAEHPAARAAHERLRSAYLEKIVALEAANRTMSGRE